VSGVSVSPLICQFGTLVERVIQASDFEEKLSSVYRAFDVLNDTQHTENSGHHLIENNEFTISSVYVKCIFSNDTEKSLRSDFISGIFSKERISEYDIRLDTIPKPYEQCDIFVMSSNDTDRIMKFMKVNSPLCNSLPKICITHKMQPKKRARLLNAGFDDVMDMAQIKTEEAKARILAIINRYTSSRTKFFLKAQYEELLSEVVNLKKITPTQMRILVRILSHKGRVCPLYSLQIAGSLTTEPISVEHLRVLIHYIRSALHEPFDIQNSSGMGYQIVPRVERSSRLYLTEG
jgi:DNA-binding winged helix-turn-helix (wHTH) protein